MRLIRAILLNAERALLRTSFGDWLACRRYARLAAELEADQPGGSRPLTPEFQRQRRELRRRRLSLELGHELDRITAGTEVE
jgi:hypothetical protein